VFSGNRFDDVANKKTLAGYGLLNIYGTYEVKKSDGDWSLE
jgi:outer membrane receptor protein involved in Fe transport